MSWLGWPAAVDALPAMLVQGLCLLRARNGERTLEISFSPRGIRLWRHERSFARCSLDLSTPRPAPHRDTLEVHPEVLKLEQIAEQLSPRRRQNVRLGNALQACRKVGGSRQRCRAPGPPGPDEIADRDHADRNSDAPGERQPGPNCALGVVFVGMRIAEITPSPMYWPRSHRTGRSLGRRICDKLR